MRFRSGLSDSSGMLRVLSASAGPFMTGAATIVPLNASASVSCTRRRMTSMLNHSPPCRPDSSASIGPGCRPRRTWIHSASSAPFSPTVTGIRITARPPGSTACPPITSSVSSTLALMHVLYTRNCTTTLVRYPKGRQPVVNAAASSSTTLRIPNPPELRPNKGFQPFLAPEEMPYLFVDACMQAWPDADYANAHRHGVTALAVTAWRPHADLAGALEEGMFWHLVARKHPNTLIAYTAEDIRRARREQRVALIVAAQGGDFIERKLHRIEAFYRLGLRIMLPAYNAANSICGGCLDRDEI